MARRKKTTKKMQETKNTIMKLSTSGIEIRTRQSISADEIASRPPYMYTTLCPDPRYRIGQRPFSWPHENDKQREKKADGDMEMQQELRKVRMVWHKRAVPEAAVRSAREKAKDNESTDMQMVQQKDCEYRQQQERKNGSISCIG